eukprot:gnl/MRDRNA2_/MRDRNA2_82856_c0_seq1.p1 gnl/MRDRNA2_/MRDRNA2_82856_c0~~gnl/MRDRNA2_/MRDRNA2_82856_c0_seq1.p1  ORF type:complete len:905 (+),score=154.03 gnl/MRDRNA2_/MRDRNA2_82856_c0_seq1:84-2717(+)
MVDRQLHTDIGEETNYPAQKQICECGSQVRFSWPPPPCLQSFACTPETGGVVSGIRDGQGKAVCWHCWSSVAAEEFTQAQEVAESVLGKRKDDEASRMQSGSSEENVDSESDRELLKSVGSESKRVESDPKAGSALLVPGDGKSLSDSAVNAKSFDVVAEVSEWSQDEIDEWKRKFEQWWWYNKTEDVIDVEPAQFDQILDEDSASASVAAPVEGDSQLQRITRCITEIDGTNASSDGLHVLDSLHVGLLTKRLREEFIIPDLSVSAVRRAATYEELVQIVDASIKKAEEAPAHRSGSEEPSKKEFYKLYFSPGQHVPMGSWVMRSNDAVEIDRLQHAVSQLVDRHPALRSRLDEPWELFSSFVDLGVSFTLWSRLAAKYWSLGLLRRILSWALMNSWPNLEVVPRTERYASHKGEVPFEVVEVDSQKPFEEEVRWRRNLLRESCEPLDVCLIRMQVQLTGIWVFGNNGGQGDFWIFPRESENGIQLVYVDRKRGDVGILVSPGHPDWVRSPHGFSALYCARLLPGTSMIWLRIGRPGELTILWKANSEYETQWYRHIAFRMPKGNSVRDCVAGVTTIDFLCIHALHSIADGQSYEPIVGDLLSLYSGMHTLLPASNGLAELQRRLHATLNATPFAAAPQQSSMRGNISFCKFRGKGYSHCIGFLPRTVGALKSVGWRFGVPLDVTLLALGAAAIMRADGSNSLDLTLYAPMRDGPGDAGAVALCADWREIVVRGDIDTATVLGVVLDVATILRTRRWAVFNAFRKPECVMVNFQLSDAAQGNGRAGFNLVGEEHYRYGEKLQKEKRGNRLERVHQKLSFVVEQEDIDNWWILLGCDAQSYPPAWTRKFVKGIEDCVEALLTNPTARLHRPFPEHFI